MGRLIPILLSVFLLCSCSSSLSDCRVVDKEYEPSCTEIILMPNGNGGMHPMPMYEPEHFIITIEGRDEKGRVKRRTVEVYETVYNETEIGDTWEE